MTPGFAPDDEDRAQLRHLVHEYARAVDERDVGRFVEVFTVDGVLRTLTGEVRGHDDLARIPPRLARYRATMHLLGNHDVELAADRATAAGTTDCVARHVYEANGVDRVYVMYLRYHDRYRRDEGVWRIEERRLELLWDEDHPLRT